MKIRHVPVCPKCKIKMRPQKDVFICPSCKLSAGTIETAGKIPTDIITAYNYFKDKQVDVYNDNSEYICSVCKGYGMPKKGPINACRKCSGDGKVDWIENITGKR